MRVLDPCLAEEPSRASVAEILLPESFFGAVLRPLPALYQEIRNGSAGNGVRLTTHASYWIVCTLSNGLYVDPDVRDIAKNLAVDIQRGRASQSKKPIVVSNSSEGFSSSLMVLKRVACSVAMKDYANSY